MKKYDVAAFIWPSYTGDDPRARIFWDEGYGEWQTVKAMTNKGYDSCRWPRKPLWGYVNETDRYVMEMQIEAAVDHGINTFIYDWYWYDNRPFLENCLNDGFLLAKNNNKMKFFLMWANHSATYLWDKRNSADRSTVVWEGSVTPEVFYKSVCARTIEKYFSKENYYKIDGCPVYMIFELRNLIKSFGTVAKTRAALDKFREMTVAAGFPGLHLQLAFFRDSQVNYLSEDDPARGLRVSKIMELLGFDSFTNYNWASPVNIDREYSEILTDMEKVYGEYSAYDIPYFPNITIGWDNNLRFKGFIPGVVRGNTPALLREACLMAKKYADEHALPAPLITLNSWNEWTETSYLEPDDLYGYGCLEAVESVFGKQKD